MLYTEKEKTEIERVRKVFAEHLQQSTNFELLWSDKVGFEPFPQKRTQNRIKKPNKNAEIG